MKDKIKGLGMFKVGNGIYKSIINTIIPLDALRKTRNKLQTRNITAATRPSKIIDATKAKNHMNSKTAVSVYPNFALNTLSS